MSRTKRFLMIVMIISCSCEGVIAAFINTKEAEIVRGLTSGLFGWWVGSYLCIIGMTCIINTTAKAYRSKIRDDMFYETMSNALESKMTDIQSISTGKVFDTVSEMQGLVANYGSMVIRVVPAIIPFAVLIIRESLYDYRMGLITLICQAISFAMASQTDRLFKWNTDAKKAKSELSGVTVDGFANIKTLKYLGQGGFAIIRLLKYQKKYHPHAVNASAILWYRVINVLTFVPLFVNVFLSRDNIEIMAFIVISNYTIENVNNILLDIAELRQEINACKKVLSPLKGDDTNTLDILGDNTLILDNIYFDYGDESTTFNIDHLEFKPHTRTLVYGESGEGKSSLANLISGGIKPKIGNVPYYKSYYIWQETEMLDDTLWHNIVFNNREGVTQNEIFDLFKRLNMFDWFLDLPDGFDTIVGERGCRLSSGQKQRINIIRLVLNMRYHPENVFIIDEITSNLDASTRELAIKLIDRECKSTLICISHNEGFDKICDSAILVKNKKFHPHEIEHPVEIS